MQCKINMFSTCADNETLTYYVNPCIYLRVFVSIDFNN